MGAANTKPTSASCRNASDTAHFCSQGVLASHAPRRLRVTGKSAPFRGEWRVAVIDTTSASAEAVIDAVAIWAGEQQHAQSVLTPDTEWGDVQGIQ